MHYRTRAWLTRPDRQTDQGGFVNLVFLAENSFIRVTSVINRLSDPFAEDSVTVDLQLLRE